MSGKGRVVLFGGFVVALTYLVIMYLGIGYSKDVCDTNASSILFSRILCQNSNEIGDFLAGAFAPLAFVFLVVAVLLQTFELSAQREELELTRAQMAESTDALEAQSRALEEQSNALKLQSIESRKQAEFIGQQTVFSEFDRRNKTFDALINKIAFRVRLNTRFSHYTREKNRGQNWIVSLTKDERNEWDDRLIYRVGVAISHFCKKNDWENTEIWISEPGEFAEVYVAVETAVSLIGDLDESGQAKASAIRIYLLWRDLEQLLANCSNNALVIGSIDEARKHEKQIPLKADSAPNPPPSTTELRSYE